MIKRKKTCELFRGFVDVERSEGVAGRADPTAWERIEVVVNGPRHRLTVVFSASWETVATVRFAGKDRLFVSGAINRWLHKPVCLLFGVLKFWMDENFHQEMIDWWKHKYLGRPLYESYDLDDEDAEVAQAEARTWSAAA